MCGIIGGIASSQNSLDINMLRLLMIGNRNRGGTSTGVALMDIKGNKDVRKVMDSPEDALVKHSIFKSDDLISMTIGHNRSPSVGTKKTIDQAHPMLSGNITLVHNGTIYNAEELANKYKVKFESDDTDTYILTKIFNADKGKHINDFLSNYSGSASLLWFDDNDPNFIFAFRGESRSTSYADNESEERPLYMYNSDHGMYFSSVEDYLKIISDGEDDFKYIRSVNSNMVIKVNNEDNSITEVASIDRSESTQVKTWSNSPGKTEAPSKGSHQTQMSLMSSGSKGTTQDLSNNIKTLQDRYSTYNPTADIDYGIISTSIFNRGVKEETDPDMLKGLIHFFQMRYWMDGRLMNGVVNVTVDGYVTRYPSANTLKYAFICGYLLRDVSLYRPILGSYLILLTYGTQAAYDALRGVTDMPIGKISKSATEIKFYTDRKNRLYNKVYEPFFASIRYYDIVGGNVERAVNFKESELTEGKRIFTNDWSGGTIIGEPANGIVQAKDIYEDKISDYFLDEILMLDGNSGNSLITGENMIYTDLAYKDGPVQEEHSKDDDTEDAKDIYEDIVLIMENVKEEINSAIEEMSIKGDALFQEGNSINVVEDSSADISILEKMLKLF